MVVPRFRKLHVYLVIAQLCFAGFEILSRIALNGGTHPLAFTFYRNCVASILLGSLAITTEKKRWPTSFTSLLYIFGLGFLGSVAVCLPSSCFGLADRHGMCRVTVNQVCYMTGLKYTSAIFASAMRNTTPVFTFLIAVLSRIEKVNLKRRDGQAKLLGSILGLCGSLLLAIYRGPVVIDSNISVTKSAAPRHSTNAKQYLDIFGKVHLTLAAWQIGAILLAVSCLSFAAFLILQSPFLDKHCAPISFAAVTCLSSTIQIPLLGLIYERHWSSWRLSSSSEGLTILYAGVVGSGLVSSIQSWGVLTGGPVIVAAYQPLETIFTALFSMVFLKEDLHLGSVLGGVVVIGGLYLLIWGQKLERELDDENSVDPALQSLELHPHLAARRHSCDLETRHKQEASIRRHSTTCTDLKGTQLQQQGPLRRLSSTLSNLVRSLEKDPEAKENLLAGGNSTHDQV